MDLNQLLDNDYLTPQQERYIRSLLVSYRLERKGSYVVVFFKINQSREKSPAYKHKSFLSMRNDIYKNIMYEIILLRARTVKTKNEIDQLISIMKSSDANNYFTKMAVYTTKFSTKFPTTYKAKDLYMAIQIIKEYGRL